MTVPPGWLVVAGDFAPGGGMDAANWALARGLARAGPVTLVTHRAAPDLAHHHNVTVRRVSRPLGKHMLGEPLLARAGRLAARGYDPRRVVVNGGNCVVPAVNWVHYLHAAAPPTPPAGALRSLKYRWHHARSTRLEHQALVKAAAVVCNSHITARHVETLIGVGQGSTRVVYYGTDPFRFPAAMFEERVSARCELGWREVPWAVFVGALGDRRKGFDTLYAAWKLACERPGFDANLAVVGRGGELPEWERRARADGLADRVRFLGFRSDVPAILAAADVMVHPARYEAYGLGVHEALCRGLPALVSAGAGVAERYPAALADLLIPDPDDAGGLADRLLMWRRDLDRWPGRVAPFAAKLRSRTWDDMAAEFADVVGGRAE